MTLDIDRTQPDVTAHTLVLDSEVWSSPSELLTDRIEFDQGFLEFAYTREHRLVAIKPFTEDGGFEWTPTDDHVGYLRVADKTPGLAVRSRLIDCYTNVSLILDTEAPTGRLLGVELLFNE